MVAVVAPEHGVNLQTVITGPAARLFNGVRGEVVISGPQGTGKTRAILEWIHWRCSNEHIRVLMLRKTLESLKGSALVTFQEQVLHDFDGKRSVADGVTYFGGNTITPARFTYEQTGSVIICGGMDRPEKVLSTEYDIIYAVEATELQLDEWEKLAGRTDRPRTGEPRPPAVVIGDCNPDAPTHWIKRRAETGALQLWLTTHRDNPAMWDRETKQWTPAGKRYLWRLRYYTGVRRDRYLMGKWVAAEGQVYDGWRDEVHVVKREDVQDQLSQAWHFGSCDWGYTNPGVLQAWAVDYDGRMYLNREWYMTRKPMEGWWIPRAVQMSRDLDIREWVCDPSEPAFIAQFNAAGLNATAAINDILPGITAVQNRLSSPTGPRIFILEDALIERDEELARSEKDLPLSTLQEIPRYVWAKNVKGDSLKDKPADGFDHGNDAMRYAVAHMDLNGSGEIDDALLLAFSGLPR